MGRITLGLIVGAALCAGAMQASAQVQGAGVETLEERDSEGRLLLSVQVRSVEGQTQRHGTYRRWHAGAVPAIEGAYENGLPSGPWQAWRADGSLLLSGTFLEGRRSGKWEFTHPDGELAGVGSYLLGCRDRRWVYFDAEGVKREDESGLYRVEKANHPNRSRRLLGETLDGVPHGEWNTWWPSGVPQTRGSFAHGVRSGELQFFLLDGTPEREFISGVYVDGERRADAPVAVDAFRLPEERALEFAGTAAIDLTALPRAARAPGVKNAERDRTRQWIALYRAAADEAERRKAELVLVQQGRAAVSELLEELRALDLEDAGQRAQAAGISGAILRGIAHAGFAWDTDEGEAALAANRLAILRWYTWWELVRENEDYWSAVAAAGTGGGPVLLDLRWIDGEARPAAQAIVAAAPDAAPAVVPELFVARRKGSSGKATRNEVEDALEWLAQHQSPDGGWSTTEFVHQCPQEAGELCTGSGNADHDVGVSALALLAFMAQGNTASTGAHSAVVARGLTWLLATQDEATGLFGDRVTREFLYHHAIATEALAEAALFSAEPELVLALQRAVDLIAAARNPKGAWRYSLPPNGENDTSVTSWMVTALVAAERAGARVDSNNYAGARWWLEQATDPENGRIGYDTRGSRSGRLAIQGNSFPSELVETMTAAGLHAALALGSRHFDARLLERSRELLFACPPAWADDGSSNDLYYWFHGAQALQGDRSRAAKAWRRAMTEILVDHQRRDSHRAGSWDPSGPWGFVAGRVYSTAMGALALQAEWRDAH